MSAAGEVGGMQGGLGWLRAHGPGVALDVGVNIAAPFLVYSLAEPRWGMVPALLASSVPPLLWSIGGFLRHRRLDALSVLVLASIALSLLAFLGGGSPRMLQLREKTVTLLIALAFLGSAAIRRPLIGPLARATMARHSQARLDAFDAARENAAMQRTIMVMTLVWGFVMLAEFLVAVVLVFTLSVPTYLVVGPVVGHGTLGALALWTFLYARRQRRMASGVRE